MNQSKENDTDMQSDSESDNDSTFGDLDIEDAAGTRYCVYVLLALPKSEVDGHADDYVFDLLRTELESKMSKFEKRRLYIGRQMLLPGEPVQARPGQFSRDSAFRKALNAEEWKIYEWIAVECATKTEMYQLETRIRYYCLAWREGQAGVECINRNRMLGITASDVKRTLLRTKNGGHWTNPLAVYNEPTGQQDDKTNLGFYVAVEQFKEYKC